MTGWDVVRSMFAFLGAVTMLAGLAGRVYGALFLGALLLVGSWLL